MVKLKISRLFVDFFESERAGGFILISCAVVSILLANAGQPAGTVYAHFWHTPVLGKPLEFWINDGLMTIFFLMVGLEIEREVYNGELSDLKKAVFPALAAIGGMLVPALIHFFWNKGTLYESGFGIPMATDIAFSLAVLSLLGNRVPYGLKVFLTALAIIDDIGAIVIIALFYTSHFSWLFFFLAMACFAVLLVLNRLKIYRKWPYILIGIVMWVCMYKSGIHATITGVLLAFAFPFGKGDDTSPSVQLQSMLHKPVAFVILPLFALANTVIVFPDTIGELIGNSNTLGVLLGLVAGKPLGIMLFCALAIYMKWSELPSGVTFLQLLGAGCLAGIGFTMSIFITLLAFPDNAAAITGSKIAIIIASVLSGVIGYIILKWLLPKDPQSLSGH
ncbi:MAG: Na+/H+ antiporter NhaA [Sediminibacterium sp.]|nr:Na+/H+ antiporter NhaA [Sediminibacterium sp.]